MTIRPIKIAFANSGAPVPHPGRPIQPPAAGLPLDGRRPLILPDGTRSNLGAMAADDQFAPILSLLLLCRPRPATADNGPTSMAYTVEPLA